MNSDLNQTENIVPNVPNANSTIDLNSSNIDCTIDYRNDEKFKEKSITDSENQNESDNASSAKKIRISKEDRERIRLKKQEIRHQREMNRLELDRIRFEKEKIKAERLKMLLEQKEKREQQKKELKEQKEMKERIKMLQKEEKNRLREAKEEEKIRIREAKEKDRQRKFEEKQASAEKAKEKELKAQKEKDRLERSKAVLFNFLKKPNNDQSISLDDSNRSIIVEDLDASFQNDTSEADLLTFENSILEQNATIEDLYLNSLLTGKRKPGFNLRTQDEQDNVQCNNVADNIEDLPENYHHVKYIYLKFDENVKPPYFGPKQHHSLINGRNPFVKIPSLDYEIDSDLEWEEGGPGESLSSSDSETEDKDDYEIDNDFFVPHGYLSDDEFQEDRSDSFSNANDRSEHQKDFDHQKQRSFMKEQTLMSERSRNFANAKLIPEIIGCVWARNKHQHSEKFEFLEQFKAIRVPKI